jgi:hypothetical protein
MAYRFFSTGAVIRRSANVRCTWVLIALTGWSVVGCGSTPSSQERAAHREPANRPSNLESALRQLQALRAQVAIDLDSSTPKEEPAQSTWPQRRAQIAELAEWLPELAADSDLTEAQWQQVQTASASFSERLARSTGGQSTLSVEAWQQIDLAELLRHIEAVLPESDRARAQLKWLSE